MPNVEPYLSQIIAYVLPYASDGLLAAACVVALSRLPILNIAAMMVSCACLGAYLSSGAGGMDVAMQVAAAGGAAGAMLLLSGGQLWRRPAMRALLRRRGARERGLRAGDQSSPQPSPSHGEGAKMPTDGADAADSPSPQPSPLQGEGAEHAPSPSQGEGWDEGRSVQHAQSSLQGEGGTQPAPSPCKGEGWDEGGSAQSIPFRLAAVLVIVLTVGALATLVPLSVPVADMRLALWLAGMGLFAGLSSGSAIVSATGYIVALSAATLLIPGLVTDVTRQPLVYAALAAVMVIAALGFSFASGWRRD